MLREAPEGSSTMSVGAEGGGGGGRLAGGVEAPGTAAMASCKRHLTSSPVATSRGHCPSWFFIIGSAP